MATILETMEGLAFPPGASETLKQGDSLTRHALGMRLAWPHYSPHDGEAVQATTGHRPLLKPAAAENKSDGEFKRQEAKSTDSDD